ncbi:protein FAM200A-like [Metopolophium dirhodum]|uniref:protein FAM200A-like n=1 Tax=Metopolophium dirhodum TaxID=44670 RepID=UPI00298F6BFB|nr:protein FAM200A-like [Metopolophium dirhodum]
MDKFIIKKVSTSVNTSTDGSTDLPLPSSSTINDKTVKRRKYKDNYLNFGFTFIGDDNNQIPQCIVCGVTLSNEKKKPHTIGEELILPACKEIVDVMFGKEAAEQISNIPLSNDTVRRRIITMSEDIVKNVNEILQKDKEFALYNLMKVPMFLEKIIEQFLFCRELQTTTTGVDVFNAVDNYFEENNMVWSNCISICTDGAAAMTGRFKGFLTLAKNKKPNLITIHCFLHREALIVKSSDGGELSDVLKTVIEMINYIKKRPVKCRIFEELCKNIGTEHTTLLYHTEIRCLSRGPCGEENIKNANLSSTEKEQLLEISSDTTLKSKFYMSENDSFWISLQNEYPEVSKKAMQILLPFSTSYMCESAFSILKVTKTKKRSTLKDIETLSEARGTLDSLRVSTDFGVKVATVVKRKYRICEKNY